MKSNTSLLHAFRRTASFLPATRMTVGTADGEIEANSFCRVSFDPPTVALTLPAAGATLPDREFTVSGAGVAFECTLLDTKRVGDHTMLFASVSGVKIRGGPPKVKWRGAWFDLQFSYPFLESSQALEAFVASWRMGVLPKERWTHSAHVAVTGYYAFEHEPDAVFSEMKRGILYFNMCTGVANGPDSGYHETLTRFWSNRITLSVRAANLGSRMEAARHAVRVFGEDRDLSALYYSFPVARDRRARSEWIAPDLEPLPEWCGLCEEQS